MAVSSLGNIYCAAAGFHSVPIVICQTSCVRWRGSGRTSGAICCAECVARGSDVRAYFRGQDKDAVGKDAVAPGVGCVQPVAIGIHAGLYRWRDRLRIGIDGDHARCRPDVAHGELDVGASAVPRRGSHGHRGRARAGGLVQELSVREQPPVDHRHLRAVLRLAGAAALLTQGRNAQGAVRELVCARYRHAVSGPRQPQGRGTGATSGGCVVAPGQTVVSVSRRHPQPHRRIIAIQGRATAGCYRCWRAGGSGGAGRLRQGVAGRWPVQGAPRHHPRADRYADRCDRAGCAGSPTIDRAGTQGRGCNASPQDLSSTLMDFVVPHDHPCLPGHFPGRPVVPGVVVLDHVLQAVEALHGPRAAARLPQVKFVQPLLPGQTASVTLEGDGPRWRFRVQRADVVLVSGELVAEAGT
ncbi:3-hydroxymyristoyl/3-hydroxydecanoyl-(acyl carrier protein) dehydratases [Xanthomonas oryzae pv. oryzae KACC 10331]|uniref:3-hydroxymyristoyl/3-hydroxydecanoyl-(Acyl carrier protein) dehydratases n=3 Tax=Xanthomonas oryzae pv. oryzae TaxID=64187 RepID=Q5GUQ2_XANOR|nr:3-hydroxymyristoyl/3-hydroxydecanoyl-(acyl carrier protein) dehydratases [Xanthomonas oryzae pv. oryzae KACC 10331]